jgi:hypothetical protein
MARIPRIARVSRGFPTFGLLAVLAAVLLGALPATATSSGWVHDPVLNDAICTQVSTQTDARVCADGTGGWIVAWVDQRGGSPALYAQRLSAAGVRLWAVDGVLAFQTYGFFTDYTLVGDGQGGAFLAAVDSHDALYYHVYLQRLTSAGARVAGTGGTVVVTGVNASQVAPALANPEPGVAIVVFQDSRAAGGDLYAQRMTAAGSLTWGTGGAAVCTQAGAQVAPVAVPDGAGGVLVFWEDERNLGVSDRDLYGQRLNTAGALSWTAAGTVVCTAAGTQQDLCAVSDGSGGAIVAWEDARDAGSNGLDIYAQRVNGAGTARWFNNGRAVCGLAGGQADPVVAADPYGGAWFAWTDARADAWTGAQIYAQALAGDGLARWTAGGVPAGPAAGEQFGAVLAATGDGAAALAWTDERTGYQDVRGQRFDVAGAAQWETAGLLVGGAPFNQHGVGVAAGTGGEILAVWDDERLAADVYAQRVDRTGWLGDPAPALVSAADRPDDQGGQVRLTWSPSWLDAWGEPGVTTYHVLNRRPGAKARGGAADAAKGNGAGADDLRAWLLDGWTEVAQVPPLQLASYAVNAPTYGDWTGSSQPVTEFMVVAEAGSHLLPSGVLSGHSVDNLSPGAPLNLLAQSDHFDVLLAWQPSGVLDEDLHHYNVYRSGNPAFVPGPATLLTDTVVTTYAEVRVPQGRWYFRVTAVDIHGNESVPSDLAEMLSLVAVDGAGPPARLAVRSATPNPFNPVTEIRCELPAAGAVRLQVYDVAGRPVRGLVDGARGAGTFTVTWDGRDDTGRTVPSGVYFARLTAGAAESVLKLVLAR